MTSYICMCIAMVSSSLVPLRGPENEGGLCPPSLLQLPETNQLHGVIYQLDTTGVSEAAAKGMQ